MSFVDWKGEGVRLDALFILFKEMTFFEENYFYRGNSDFSPDFFLISKAFIFPPSVKKATTQSLPHNSSCPNQSCCLLGTDYRQSLEYDR